MHKLLLPLLSLLLLNCKESKKIKEDTLLAPQTQPAPPVTAVDDSIPPWVNRLVARYVEMTDNKMIKATRQDKDPITWTLSNKENTDTAVYFVFQIGHSFENNRITDGWVYIDSLARKLYEFDIATEKLTWWNDKID